MGTNHLQYYIIPGSSPSSDYIDIYNSAFDCWKGVWTEALKEFGVDKKLFSDNFTRQDYVGALFYKKTCVALSFLKFCNAQLPEFKEESYFENWSDSAREKIKSRGNNILICSQFTIHPIARGNQLGFPTKDILTGIMIETFLNSSADAMTGALRVARGVNKASEKWGAELIEKDVQAKGYATELADLVGYFKDKITKFDIQSEHYDDVKSLWNNRIVINKVDRSEEFMPQKIKAA